MLFKPNKLEAFAMEKIAASHYPQANHVFRPFECEICGVTPHTLTIEHHSGSKKSSFRGVIHTRCTQCGFEKRVFSFTGEHRTPEREEKPRCRCGEEGFYLANLERYEGVDEMAGFFDEGVIVGQCASCGRRRVMVFTD